ncbi:Ribonuclease H superfamily [Sesbania bispinosa]|nr:Ribonuclease H superfamily [Sesbania bispinosa]
MAYNMNWSKVVIESDCLPLVQACRKERVIGEVQMIVSDILTMADGFIHCGFSWVQHQGNQVAHHLAKSFSRGGLPLYWVSNLPHWLKALATKDMFPSAAAPATVAPSLVLERSRL